MSTQVFPLITLMVGAGVAITFMRLAKYRRSPGRTAHGEALIMATGFGFSWLTMFGVWFLATPRGAPTTNNILAVVVFSLAGAGTTYCGMRLVLWIRSKLSKVGRQ